MRDRRLTRPVLALALGVATFLAATPLTHAPRCATSPPGSAGQRVAPDALPRQQILRRSLRADPSQSYLLYLPRSVAPGTPVFVTVHGVSLNVEEHAARFAPFAERHGVVLVAPAFTGQENDDYQRLGRIGRGGRADHALDAILEEVRELTGAATERFHLFGFSGGAQFAHRYVLAHPERIADAVIAAPGWYLFPDFSTPYPYGLGPGPELPDARFEPERFLRVPLRVIVGEADTTSRNLRREQELDRQQGTTRVERAERWTGAMRRAAESRGLAPLVTLERVPGIGHSFGQFMSEGGLGERVFEAMFVSAAESSRLTSRGTR